MSLREIFQSKTTQQGFTLVELLLVVALMLIMSVFMFPLGFSFYQSQMLDETQSGIVSALRRAQMFSVSGKHDSAFGVRFIEQAYVIFEGQSYQTRTSSQDEVFVISSMMHIAGLQEVVFTPISGEPDIVGDITVGTGSQVRTIEIYGSGLIEQ